MYAAWHFQFLPTNTKSGRLWRNVERFNNIVLTWTCWFMVSEKHIWYLKFSTFVNDAIKQLWFLHFYTVDKNKKNLHALYLEECLCAVSLQITDGTCGRRAQSSQCICRSDEVLFYFQLELSLYSCAALWQESTLSCTEKDRKLWKNTLECWNILNHFLFSYCIYELQ